MHFYTLLYLDQNRARAANARVSGLELLRTYVRNAVTLGHTLRRHGFNLTVVCNNATLMRELADGINSELPFDCCHIEGNLIIPPGIGFEVAHYKIEAMAIIGERKEDYSVLLDNDVYCLRGEVGRLVDLKLSGVPAHYDISEQVIPVYTEARIRRDVHFLFPAAEQVKWYGGEFIAGSSGYFCELARNCMGMYSAYVRHINELHHHGDEMLMAAACERMRQDGWEVQDVGPLGLVRRYWSGRPLHSQPSLMDAYESTLLLHLPQNKILLSELAEFSGVRTFEELDRMLLRGLHKARCVGEIRYVVRKVLRRLGGT